jgi:hypothetical protein
VGKILNILIVFSGHPKRGCQKLATHRNKRAKLVEAAIAEPSGLSMVVSKIGVLRIKRENDSHFIQLSVTLKNIRQQSYFLRRQTSRRFSPFLK